MTAARDESTGEEATPQFCHRCGAVLSPGRGDHFVVRIEAFADPTPPRITAEDLAADLASEIDRLIDAAGDLSEREMMDQVHCRFTIMLCWPCYRTWIEDPAGAGGRADAP